MVEHSHFQFTLNLVEDSHFIWWNTVIFQFGGTWSFLTQSLFNSVEHGHFYIFLIWWNTVSHFSIHSQCGTQPFLSLVEHGHFHIYLIWWNSHFSIWGNMVILLNRSSWYYYTKSCKYSLESSEGILHTINACL